MASQRARLLHGAVPVDAAVRERCLELLRLVRDDPSSHAFRQPVSRKKVPAYYEVISQPMDLKTLEAQTLEGRFGTLEDFANALRLIWRNAFMFNEAGDRHGRQVFENAKALAIESEQHLEALFAEIESRPEVGSAPERVPVMQRLQLELARMRANPLALWFRDPVSAELHPEYYEAIAEPMDLRTALSSIDLGHWSKPAQVEAGVHLIWTNARAYNGEGSAIDAAALCCCHTWNARYTRALEVAPRQRKLRRLAPAAPLDHSRLALLDLCRRLPARVLRQAAAALGSACAEPAEDGSGAISIDLSRADEPSVLAALRVGVEYIEQQQRAEAGEQPQQQQQQQPS